MYEHPQNVLLVKLINANLDLLAVHREGGGEGTSAGEYRSLARLHTCTCMPCAPTGRAGLHASASRCCHRLACSPSHHAPQALVSDAEETAQAQLGRSLRLWLDLQNSLNALIDTNAGGCCVGPRDESAANPCCSGHWGILRCVAAGGARHGCAPCV